MCWNKVKQMGYSMLQNLAAKKSPAKSPKISSSKSKPPIPSKSKAVVRDYHSTIVIVPELSGRGGATDLRSP